MKTILLILSLTLANTLSANEYIEQERFSLFNWIEDIFFEQSVDEIEMNRESEKNKKNDSDYSFLKQQQTIQIPCCEL